MNLGERLQKSKDKGYMPVHVESEHCYFFIENNRDFKIGELIDDGLGNEYKIIRTSDKELEVE
jgi:hypothetical protein